MDVPSSSAVTAATIVPPPAASSAGVGSGGLWKINALDNIFKFIFLINLIYLNCSLLLATCYLLLADIHPYLY